MCWAIHEGPFVSRIPGLWGSPLISAFVKGVFETFGTELQGLLVGSQIRSLIRGLVMLLESHAA